VAKTCADYPGRCHSGQPVGAGGSGGGGAEASTEGGDARCDADGSSDAREAAAIEGGDAGQAFQGLDDGCGGKFFCACPNGAAAANDACNDGGVCAPADCHATNRPPGPQGTNLYLPAVVVKKQVDSVVATAVCAAQRMLTLPAPENELSWEITTGFSAQSTGEPVCRSTNSSQLRIGVKLNDCGNINRFQMDKTNTAVTDYCVYCDPNTQTNVCRDTWEHKQTQETLSGSGMIGVEVKRNPSDFIIAALGPVGQVGIVNRILGIIAGPIDAVAEVKLNKSFGGFVRGFNQNDQRGTGVDCPPTGENCNLYRLQVGPQFGLGAKLKISIPSRNSWFRFVRFGVDIDLSGTVGGIVQFRNQTGGTCANEDCFGLGMQLVGTGRLGLGAKVALWEGGVQWALTCRASFVFNNCQNPANRRENEPWRCRWNQTNDFSGL
jgi:hypothetical protein